jgi:hypothetical protein
MNKLSLGFLVVILILLSGVSYLLVTGRGFTTPEEGGEGEEEEIACTMDAKICPDGSAVGRVAPKCEFAACPALETPVPPEEPVLEATTTATTTASDTTISST